VFALLIIGPPGAGKTEVLAALSDALVADEVRHATIEVEALTSAYPALADDQWDEPVRAVCALYRRFAYELLLLTATVESQQDLDAVLAAIDADSHSVVRLEADPVTLRRRIADREPEDWPGLDRLLAAADRLVPVNAGLDGIALAVSTEGARPAAVAERIRDALSLRKRRG
jgi:broad-specificity NMP kinase